VCNLECPEYTRSYGTCCLCNWIIFGFKCKHYKCDPDSENCHQKQAELIELARREAEQEYPDYIEED